MYPALVALPVHFIGISLFRTAVLLDSTLLIMVPFHCLPWVVPYSEHQRPWWLYRWTSRYTPASLLVELMSSPCQRRPISDYFFKVSMQNEDVWKWLTMPATYLQIPITWRWSQSAIVLLKWCIALPVLWNDRVLLQPLTSWALR